MRARLTTTRRVPWCEWIIVSRWGVVGEHLSVGRTKAVAETGRAAPIHLVPRETALADLLRLPFAPCRPTFMFRQSRCEADTVAGRFVSVTGSVRLCGDDSTLRLSAEGRRDEGTATLDWRLDALREAWLGEFIAAVPRR
jgi:hypothetical protein